MSRDKVPVLLWWSWKSEKGAIYWWYRDSIEASIKTLRTAVAAILNLNYLNWLALWNDFENHPSPLTAKNFAEYSGFYLDSEATQSYPILVFINPQTKKYMLYSDANKQRWYLEINGKKVFSHSIDSIVLYAWWYFKHTSLKSSHIFNAFFQKKQLVSGEWKIVWDTIFHYGGEPDMSYSWVPIYQ